MKFPISKFQFPICRSAAKADAPRRRPLGNWQLAIGNRQSRSGIALVITLILLSVTLVMAVAFLALSRRDRNAVATTTDTAMARLAADSALAAVQAQIAANIFSTTNVGAYNFGLLVSTNYINGDGFDSTVTYVNPTNVSYVYPNGNPLTANDLIQNSANLLFLPRAPVFVPTNQPPYGYDFRYYLDLNRNGRFETNGNILELDSLGNPIGIPGLHVGDPEWIGVLERPDQPHGPNNHFIARYAFLAQPIGNGLDLNYIHNQAVSRDVNTTYNLAGVDDDGYFRNQGVGSWELNLAAFLADLNTNIWSQDNFSTANYYQYNEPMNYNRGIAFEDARALLSYRYNFNYNSLETANNFFPFANSVFPNDLIDGYSDGPQQTTVDTNADFFFDVPSRPWMGANNTNRFFSIASELFDPTKSSGGPVFNGFTNRLINTGSSNATYDRYTFYRMLDQLGTDSSADDGKMNLNYRNVTNGAVVVGMETNLYPWTGQWSSSPTRPTGCCAIIRRSGPRTKCATRSMRTPTLSLLSTSHLRSV